MGLHGCCCSPRADAVNKPGELSDSEELGFLTRERLWVCFTLVEFEIHIQSRSLSSRLSLLVLRVTGPMVPGLCRTPPVLCVSSASRAAAQAPAHFSLGAASSAAA